jgi:ABC-type dipeptide/oligopeptide/nickel transport system permease subunit
LDLELFLLISVAVVCVVFVIGITFGFVTAALPQNFRLDLIILFFVFLVLFIEFEHS